MPDAVVKTEDSGKAAGPPGTPARKKAKATKRETGASRSSGRTFSDTLKLSKRRMMLIHDAVREHMGTHQRRLARANDSTAYIDSDGTLHCSGKNNRGQAPGRAALPGRFLAVTGGKEHFVAIDALGNLVRIGHDGRDGAKGRSLPEIEDTPGPFVAVACGNDFTVALHSNGSLSQFGGKQLNLQSLSRKKSQSVSALSAGPSHLLVLMSDGTVKGVGRGSKATECPKGPYSMVSAGEHHSAGVLIAGGIDFWGSPFENAVEWSHLGASKLPTGTSVTGLACGASGTSYVLLDNGQIVRVQSTGSLSSVGTAGVIAAYGRFGASLDAGTAMGNQITPLNEWVEASAAGE